MKKKYLFLTLLFCISLGFSQSVIVTIDRANIVGPTDTGNPPNISSIGLTRGAGVNMATASIHFTSRPWEASSQAEAVTNDEYIQWSVSASSSNSVEVTGFDIRNRRDSNGPTNWQVFYSLDNFATAGVAATAVQVSTSPASDYNFSGLSIVSGTNGTITFRLYAWNATTVNGWFSINNQDDWSDFGIASPGLRIWGNINATTPNSTESNIVTSVFDEPDNIDYSSYSVTSGLTIANSIKVGQFTIQDGGDDLTDADALGTILTDIEFDISGDSNIAALAIFDGVTNIGETSTITSSSTAINSLNTGTGITALDEGSKSFDVYATFNSVVTDNDQFQLSISSAVADVINGSSFSTIDAGGPQTSTAGDDNRIEVTTNGIVFDQQPADGNQFETMTPFPTVLALDANGNLDLDASGTITVVTAGSLTGAPLDYPLVSGISIFDSLVFTEKEIDIELFAIGSGVLGFVISDPFDINGPLLTIAIQDFDGTPIEWNYSNNVPFFDNTWGTDGYYGIIDLDDASPLDYSSFSNNILGENDLFDEGENGTAEFATITFDPIDLTCYEDVVLTFDWQVVGYENNGDDAQYQLIYDGAGQDRVYLFDGDGIPSDDSGTITVPIPNTVNEISLKIRVRNNGEAGYSGFDNFKLASVFDGLLYANSSWSPNAPSDTTGDDNVLIYDGTYIVGSNIEINNIYIEPGATTTVSLGQSISANGGLVNRGTLELNSASSSYSSLITTKAVQGEVTYNRHVNQFADTGSTTGNNDLISAPVTSPAQDFLALRTANPDIPSGTIGGVPSFLFGPFDNDANDYINYTAANDTDPIESGIGYRTASIAVSGSTFTFVGNVNISQDPIDINVGTGSVFNLVGNPYPSYMTLSGFLDANDSEFDPLFSGVYGYDGDATDGFQIWNLAYSEANPNAVIAPGQGFLVSSKAGGGSISFPASIRSIGTADDFIAGRLSNPNIAHIKLKLNSDTKRYFTDVYFNDNASLGLDYGYDSAVFENTPDFAIYSQLVENNNGVDLGVQSVDYSSLNNAIIPLGINANQGEQITIGIEDVNIPDDVEVYLEDNFTNIFTLLNDVEYTFTPNADLNGIGRFYLRFESDALSTTENELDIIQIYSTINPKQLHIKGQLNSDTVLTLYDIQGRRVISKQLQTNTSRQNISIENFNSGIYIAELRSDTSVRSEKIIVR